MALEKSCAILNRLPRYNVSLATLQLSNSRLTLQLGRLSSVQDERIQFQELLISCLK